MLKILLIIILFVIFFIPLYLWLTNSFKSFSAEVSVYVRWIIDTLDSMFITLSEKQVRSLMVFAIVFLGLLGSFIPGKYSEIGKKVSINRAINLNQKAKYQEAISILEDMKDLDSPIVHNELGVAYLGSGNYDWAEKEFKAAIKNLPDYSNAHYNLAVVYDSLGKEMESEFELRKAKETSRYTIQNEDYYRLSGSIFDGLFLRLFLAAIMCFVGYRLPRWVITIMKKRRINKFDDQLADGLVMASNGLRAGFNLTQALEMVSKDSKPPLSQEFELVLKEERLGARLEDALKNLYDRVPTRDTKIFVSSILILKETGGNLTEMFDTIAETIQERKRVQKKIKTMTAEGETQAYILAILPFALAFVINMINPDTFKLMYTTGLGWMIMVGMAFMEVFGLYWMLKMVKVKV